MAIQLEVTNHRYPPALLIPQWQKERTWLDDYSIPILTPHALELVPNGEIHHILPAQDGILIAIEGGQGKLIEYVVQPAVTGWTTVRQIE